MQWGHELAEALRNSQDKLIGWLKGLIEAVPNVVAAVLVLLLFATAARYVRKIVRRLLDRFSRNAQINDVIAVGVYLVVMLAGLFAALGVLHLQKTVTSLLAGAGIAGLAIGMAFRATAENLIAGVGLSVQEQFGNGDIIEAAGYMGMVEQVNLRATVLRTFEGQRVIIPNNSVYSGPVVNYTQLGQRRVDLGVGVAYDTDLERARTVAIAAVEPIEQRDASRPVECYYKEFGDSSINFVVRFWVPYPGQNQYFEARSQAVMRIKKAFDDAGITIPFPIRTLDFGPIGGTTLSEAWPDRGGSRNAREAGA